MTTVDFHQILADVVHVALHCGQHHDAFFLAFHMFHMGFQVGHCCFHSFRRLQHEGQLHLSRAEELAHHLHAAEKYGVDDVECSHPAQGLV